MRDIVLPSSKTLSCPGVQPLVGLDMAVCKGHDAQPAMQSGRVMNKDFPDHVHTETGRADVVVFTFEDGNDRLVAAVFKDTTYSHRARLPTDMAL